MKTVDADFEFPDLSDGAFHGEDELAAFFGTCRVFEFEEDDVF